MNGQATARGSIVGIVTAVPANVIRNDDCPDPAAADEAAKMTGVYARRWVTSGQSARTLCTDAARRLLPAVGWGPDAIDVLVYVTQTPDGTVPADVYRIAADLCLPHRCLCLQVNWSCAGYVNGLLTAMRMIDAGQRALLLVGDATSTICDPGDRATAPLFGDAGSATAIEGSDVAQRFVFGSDGRGADKLAAGAPPEAGWLQMDGAAVFNFTLRQVPALVADTFGDATPDVALFHQAQTFILQHLTKKMRLSENYPGCLVPINVTRFGNCSAASIPLLMCEPSDARAKMLEGATVAMLGYGAGFAWAGANLECRPMVHLELIEC